MRYIIVTFDGAALPIAHRLVLEGQEVFVCQLSKLAEKSWITDETPEVKKRRLRLYDGILQKHDLSGLLKYAESVKRPSEHFVICDYNVLYGVADQLRKLGFTGLLPNKDDYLLEKDRSLGKQFVERHYPQLKIKQSKTMRGAEQVAKFIKTSGKAWVVKSDGNFGETIVPTSHELADAQEQVITELLIERKNFDKGSITIEEFIPNPTEFFPMMAFWDGKPVYSQVELETRMLGPGDTGPQTGGNQNVTVLTELDAKVNQMFFPPAVHQLAKHRKGLFLFDAGILYDGKQFWFMEFAGNRWGWGGVFSELSAAEKNGLMASTYFEAVAKGICPYNHSFGAGTAFYSLSHDTKHPELAQAGLPLFVKGSDNLFVMQAQMAETGLVSPGYRTFDSAPIGYAVGRGETIDKAIDSVFVGLADMSFKGMYYRTKEDFASTSYSSAVKVRYNTLQDKGLF